MLLSKEVEVTLTSSNIKRLEEKGYEIPRRKDKWREYVVPRGTKILVKVEDLSEGSHAEVNVKCDCIDCKNPYLPPITYQTYLKCMHEDGKYYCKKCVKKLFSQNKRIKTLLKKSKSFEQWCYENLQKEEADEILLRWDYEKNDCKPNEVCYSSAKGHWFKCSQHTEHESELKNISRFTSGQKGSINCNQCNSFAQYLIDMYGNDAIEKYWSNKNTINPWKIYGHGNKKVYIKCQEKDYHENYKIRCNDFVNGDRCPYCSSRKIHPLDSLGQYIVDNYGQDFLNKIWSSKNKKSAFEYSPFSSQEVYWRCSEDKHEDYKRSISSSNNSEFRCPKCVNERDESFFQEKVRLYLEETNYTILHEYDCTIVPINPKTNRQLPFDNEIKELKLICEVNGKQHYELTGFHKKHAKRNNTTPEYELYYQKLKDRYKRIIAYKNEYEYLEIPYWTDDKEETWKKIIENKIKEVLINKLIITNKI